MANKVSSKLCLRCNRVLPLSQFYPNKGWANHIYHDAWCKECVARFCANKEKLQQYFFKNNRMWKEAIWETAQAKAQHLMATNEEYLSPKTGSQRKQDLLDRTTAKQALSVMNLSQYYSYQENTAEEEEIEIADEQEKKAAKYNAVWRGYFTEEQIDALEELYSQYEEDFVLDNVNIRDYARKVAKASLNADIAEDLMRRGKIPASEYKEAQKIFDDLSKSSNFAACRRKPGESSGMGTLGEIIMRLEVSGQLNENGFTFPEDDIDRIINDFRHTLRAIGTQEG